MSSELNARAINLILALAEEDNWQRTAAITEIGHRLRTEDEKLCDDLHMIYLEEVAQNVSTH